MKLIFMGDEIACSRAEKDESAETVTAFGDNGAVVFRATKVADFSLFVLEGGEWSEPEVEPSDTNERLAELEVAMNALLTGEG